MYIYHVKIFWLALFSLTVVGKLATEVEAAGEALRERVWDMVGGESWERFNYTRDNYNGP